ncbi:MAG: thioredoxin, partial [Ignavibacteria bacterium]
MNYEMKDFNKDVIEQSKKIPVLVDFWAEWCGPCRVLSPVLEKLAQKYSGKWTLVKINTDENPELAAEYGIRGIPNVKLFIEGEAVNEFVGALPEPMVEEWLKKAIPGESAKNIEEAKKLMESGDNNQARKLLEQMLKEEPGIEEAKLLLAKVLIFDETAKASELLKSLNGLHENFELADSLNTIIELINKYANNELPENVVKQKYVSAIEDLKNQKFSSALEKFIEIIKTDRNYDDDGARKACIAIFKYLGENNEITLQYRRDFGRALYV